MTAIFETISSELMAALDDEIRAIKAKGGTDQIGLHDGEHVGTAAGRTLYTFLVDSELSLPSDSPGQLKIGNSSYEVEVISVAGFEITVSMSEDVGQRIPAAALFLSLYYLLELLKTRLAEALEGRIQIDRMAPLRLFGFAGNETLVSRPVAENPDNLNPEQLQALSKCLSQRVAFIWGPPGTGKTRIIGALGRELVQLGERLLITSHTNVAVDAAVLKAIGALTPEQILDGVVIRVGQPALGDPRLQEVTLEAVADRKSLPLKEEKARVAAEREPILRDKRALESKARWIEDTSKQLDKVKSLESALDAIGQTVTGLVIQAKSTVAQIEESEARLKVAEGAGLLKRLLSGLNPERVRRDLEAKHSQLKDIGTKRAGEEHEYQQTRIRLEESRQELRRLTDQRAIMEPVPSLAELKSQIGGLETRIGKLEERITSLDKRISEITSTVVREAKVIGATLYRLVLFEDLYRSLFDTVIVDEASAVPLPNLWFASALARKRVVITGDFRQLGTIVTADDAAEYPAAAKWLAHDIFQQARLVTESRVELGDGRLAALRQQYRMHPDIGELANLLVYRDDGNPLEHVAKPKDYAQATNSAPEPGAPLVLCDVSYVNPWCARLLPGYSRYNIYSAIVAVRLAEQALADGVEQIGLVAPYRAQVKLLHRLIEEQKLDRHRVEVATVHRFQGDERSLMIFDLVDGPPFPVGRLLKGGRGSGAMRLLNVACTRAKGKLVLIAHNEHLSQKLKGDASLRLALDYVSRKGRIVEGASILRGHGDPAVARAIQSTRRTPDVIPGGVAHFNESTFYPAFQSDLIGAQTQVLIYSPFIRENRLADLMPTIQHILAKGVEVVLLTRGSNASHLAGQVAAVGVRVISRKELHEKLAFIDGKVAWFGSLNILSQSRSTEQMLRFAQPGMVSYLMELSGALSIVAEEDKKAQQQARLKALAKALSRHMTAPACPVCGGKTELRSGKYGPFFGCVGFYTTQCKGLVRVPQKALELAIEDLGFECPLHGKTVVLKRGRNGVFLGCNRYPECKWTSNI